MIVKITKADSGRHIDRKLVIAFIALKSCVSSGLCEIKERTGLLHQEWYSLGRFLQTDDKEPLSLHRDSVATAESSLLDVFTV